MPDKWRVSLPKDAPLRPRIPLAPQQRAPLPPDILRPTAPIQTRLYDEKQVTLTRRRFLAAIAATPTIAAAEGLLSGCSNTIPSAEPPSHSADVVILGATPAGIMAAQAAMREQATVILIEHSQHVGGMLTSGLMTDTIYPQGIGGLPHQFYLDIGNYYNSGGKPQYVFEPHVAEAIFNGYLSSPLCTLLLGRTLASATTASGRIQSATLDNGARVTGKQWIDASYEGDLMAQSGASYTVGRESRAQYAESYAGWGIQQSFPFSPYLSSGSLIPNVDADPAETLGQADRKIMAYTFRNCITSDRSNMAPFPQPPGYNPDLFALTARVLASNNSTQLAEIIQLQPGVNNKFCLLAVGVGSTDYIGASWAYPEGSWVTRQSVWQNHYNYVAGLLYFLSNDTSVPASIRTALKAYGLPLDEFTDNNHWPWQLYIREGRRLVGQSVVTQNDVRVNLLKPDSIGLGDWALDSHGCEMIPSTVNGAQATAQDGYFYIGNKGAPYQLPFSAMLPQSSQITNLAVPVCMSASHVGYSSVRIEPTFMILGEAAGAAAGIALESGVDLASVDIATLQSKLVNYGAILSA